MAPYVFPCHLRWSDMDPLGHVNNVQYLRYLEDARVAMLFEDAKRDGVGSLDGALVVVRHEIDYRRPLVFRVRPVPIEVWVADIRASSFVLGYRVRDEDTVYAEARSVLAPYDGDTGRARRLSPPERAWLERYRAA